RSSRSTPDRGARGRSRPRRPRRAPPRSRSTPRPPGSAHRRGGCPVSREPAGRAGGDPAGRRRLAAALRIRAALSVRWVGYAVLAMEATEARLAVYREAAVARWQARQQLERALRVFRRLRTEQARESHELEYLDYYWDEDGCLVLRARLAAEDGALLVRALDAARERVRARRPAERRAGPVEQAAANAAAFE